MVFGDIHGYYQCFEVLIYNAIFVRVNFGVSKHLSEVNVIYSCSRVMLWLEKQ